MSAHLHLAKDPLTLHFLLQCLEGLVDIIFSDNNLYQPAFLACPVCAKARRVITCRGLPVKAPTWFTGGQGSAIMAAMAILKIARMGHPVLNRTAEPVAEPSAPEIGGLIGDMIDTLADASGAGLAAPQVHVSLRLVMFHVPQARAEEEDGAEAEGCPFTVLINPEIEILDQEMAKGLEACLSLPGLAGIVPRHRRIRYRGTNHRGETVEREAMGFHARVVQHECDHLDGILYPMRMHDLSTLTFTSELRHADEAEPDAETAAP